MDRHRFIQAMFCGAVLCALPAWCAVSDERDADISLSTGVNHSAHFVPHNQELREHPSCPGCSWKNQWVLSRPISLDDQFRLPRRVFTSLTLTVDRSTATPMSVRERFSVDLKHWSSWHDLTLKDKTENAERYEMDLEVPPAESKTYQDYVMVWYRQMHGAKRPMHPLSLTQMINVAHPHWFDTHIPVIRYLQFFIDVPKASEDMTLQSLHVNLNWSTSQKREDLWFDNDPASKHRALRPAEKPKSHISGVYHVIPNQTATIPGAKQPTLRIVSDTAMAQERVCKFEVVNGSTLAVVGIQAGFLRTPEGAALTQLQFPPANWDAKGGPIGADRSPSGWAESLMSVGPPALAQIHYAMRWQTKTPRAAIAPGRTLAFELPLNPEEKTACDQLHWIVSGSVRK